MRRKETRKKEGMERSHGRSSKNDDTNFEHDRPIWNGTH